MTAPALQPNPGERRGRLAIALQEPLTTIARLRANKAVAADAESFRSHIKQVLSLAEAEARAQGYEADDVRLALFAVIALLDESVLNSRHPMFAQWSSRTLQEEVFGVHMAGELFFQYLQQLLTRPDSPDVADLLEVHSLCLLLGFKGRYAAGNGTELAQVVRQLGQRIDRVRGVAGELSPRWRPSAADIGRARDKWILRLSIAAATAALVAAGLFVYFAVSLKSGAADVHAETVRLAR